MKSVRSDALDLVDLALGITGQSVGQTEFADKILEQTIDVGALVRRGRTLPGAGGIFPGVLRNVHTDAETITTSIQPYNLGATAAFAPYPPVMPAYFDVWVIAAAVEQISGGGTLSAALFFDPPSRGQGFGIDDSGARITVSNAMPLAFWDSVVTQTSEFGLQESGNPWVRIGLRLMRAPGSTTALTFSSTSSATSTFDCQIILGLFPVGMGQDIVV